MLQEYFTRNSLAFAHAFGDMKAKEHPGPKRAYLKNVNRRKPGPRFQLAVLNLYFSVCMLMCLSIKLAGMLQGKLNSKCRGFLYVFAKSAFHG